MNLVSWCGIGIFLAAGAVPAAVPIGKSGPCPPLTRRPAGSGNTLGTPDNWAQFPSRPVPQDSFPVGTIQEPLTPAQSINCIEPAPGFEIRLWASEEMAGHIAYLQDFSFDERGRLWAVEPRSYPNTVRAAAETPSASDGKFSGGQDRIVILEDTDGDHVMDKLTVFRDGLNLPQSIVCVNGGVVVAMTPYLVYFPDHNDTAGDPEILFSGLGPTGNFDTNGGINSLMYGLDNWIYGQTGYNSSCKAEPGAVDCGRGKVWRFRHKALGHDSTAFQVWGTGPSSNAHGFGQMEDGQIFQSGASNTAHITHDYAQGAAALDIRTANPEAGPPANPKNVFFAITGDRFIWDGLTSKNAQGWFACPSTAVSSLQFYTARLFPRKYWNRYAFACEGANKLCNQDSLVLSGSGDTIGSTWRAIRLPGPDRSNLLASRDAWVAPILARTGPDGAVWVLDWNNYNILHNPASPLGQGGAWMNELRDKKTNRIYRILPEAAEPDPMLDLSHASEDDLIAAFAHPNFFWRLTAQRLLIGKGYTAALGEKLKAILLHDKSVDAVGNSPRVQHALWTLDGLGRFAQDPVAWNPVLSELLRHPAWCVRRNVLRVLPRLPAAASAIDSACSVNDPHGHVRLQALLALSEIPTRPAGLRKIYSTYAFVDDPAKAAFAASGIDTSATLPCSPSLYPADPAVPVRPERPASRLPALRVRLTAGGFRLLSLPSLPSGALSVYDLRGHTAFASRYDAAKAAWTPPDAHGLRQSLYIYAFRGKDGSYRSGNLSLLGPP